MREIIVIIVNVFVLILGFLIAKFNLVEMLAGYDKNKIKDSKGLARFVGCNLILGSKKFEN